MNIQHEIKRLQRRLAELNSWRDKDWEDVKQVLFLNQSVGQPIPLTPDQPWPSTEFPVSIFGEIHIPAPWRGNPVLIRSDVGGEGLLTIDGLAVSGIDPYHQDYQLTPCSLGNEQYNYQITAVPREPFGVPVKEPRFKSITLIVPDLDVVGLGYDLGCMLDAAGVVEPDLAVQLIHAVSDAFNRITFPRSPAEAYLSRLVRSESWSNLIEQIWESWEFEDVPLPLPDSTREQIIASRAWLADRLHQLRVKFPAAGNVFVTGHAHLDIAWLWTTDETRRKALRFSSTVLELMKKYPEFHFSQSMAQLYAFIEQDDPAMFNKINDAVRAGQWEITGGMWVEPDGNLLSGESWVRQLLYGQNYFQNHFGQRAKIAWLPDSFGYSANLPQLFHDAGLDFFFTTKLTWNETNPFPYDLYLWEGLDGTQILAHSFNDPGGYNSRLTAQEIKATWENFSGKTQTPITLLIFGWGDGGGGPTSEMIERFLRFRNFPGLPAMQTGDVGVFFQNLQRTHLPVWYGEQYLEFHRGTYTTQAKIKALNRRLEHVLIEAESLSVIASIHGNRYPREDLEAYWKTLLLNQFHDILPGSSIHSVNQKSIRDLAWVLNQTNNICTQAMQFVCEDTRCHPGAFQRIVVWNTDVHPRCLCAIISCSPKQKPFKILSPNGIEIAYQVDDNELLISGDIPIPGLGYRTFSLVPGEPSQTGVPKIRCGENFLENEFIHVEVNPDGTLGSIYDKVVGTETLSDRGNQVWIYTDIPREYDAWEIDASYIHGGVEILCENTPKITESGPLRASIKTDRSFGHSRIIQTYQLSVGSRRLEIRTQIDWQERNYLLRVLFPTTIHSNLASFETAFGLVSRSTKRETRFEKAQFEVPGLRFVDLSDESHGVSLLTNSKYGYSAEENSLGLTLLKGAVYPDPFADIGLHTFSYALFPHPGNDLATTVQEAHDLNAPLRTVLLPPGSGSAPDAKSFINIEPLNIRLAALKQAEDSDGIILRLYETCGQEGMVTIDARGILASDIEKRSLLEESLNEQLGSDIGCEIRYSPFQVFTIGFRSELIKKS